MSFFEKDHDELINKNEEEYGLPLPYSPSKFEDAPADKPAILWTLGIIGLLCLVNFVLYPATVSKSALYYQDDNFPLAQTSPGFDQLDMSAIKYTFTEPTLIARVDSKAESVVFTDSRMVTISSQDNALMTFTVPEGNGSVCELTFARPPITMTSSLTGALKAVEVWELPSDTLKVDFDRVSYVRAEETLVTTLDLTKQAALVGSRNVFACGTGEERVFEIRCAACGVQYTATSGRRIGFQLRRQA